MPFRKSVCFSSRKCSVLLLLCLLCPTLSTVETQHQASSFSSQDARSTLKSASETAQDIWRMLSPSNSNLLTSTPPVNGETPNDETHPVSVDEALQHIRGVIRILSRTHNELLHQKVANLPLAQRLWVKFFYSYGDSLAGPEILAQKHQGHSTLSHLARSARDFASISGNRHAVKENINAVTSTFAKEMLLSMSALKHAAVNAAHGGWLVTPDVKSYVNEITHNVSALSEKWLERIRNVADATKPIAENIVSNDYMQQVLKDVEEMVTEFHHEIWRMRTEWMYKRRETLSWATENLYAMKTLGKYEFDRFSEGVHSRVSDAKHLLKDGLASNRAHVAYLQHHAAERMNHFIELLMLWIDVSKGLLRTVTRIFNSYIKASWRVIAFVVVIAFFRILLNFVHPDASVRSFVSNAFSRTKMTDSSPGGSRPTSERGAGMPQSQSPARSESSESKPTMKKPTSTTRNVSKPSPVREIVTSNQDVVVHSRAQRQERRTPSQTGNVKSVREDRPLQVANYDYETALSSLEQQNDGQPICIGDHEVQLVYDDTPLSTFTDDSRNDLGTKGRTKANKSTSFRRTSRREEKKAVPERRTRGNDGDDISEATSGFESATSRQTRSSVRRTSTRRSNLR